MLQKLPIGIQDFAKLRGEGCIYVDKTSLVYDLVESGSYYFLSRPRRFGKSLLMSTLKAYFEGKKELFDGLAIADLEKKWVKRPVLHLDLNTQTYDSPERLDYVIEKFLRIHETEFCIPSETGNFGPRFERIIQHYSEASGQLVAILVDEYDKPVLQAIGNPGLQDAFRNTLKGFYGALKSMDQYIKFAMVTGVTKFSKVSIFSDLNNLNDISGHRQYAEICGLTEKEIVDTFGDYIDGLAKENGMTTAEALANLKTMYDGYRFNEKAEEGIYNPFSVLNALSSRRFGSFWFETGTPTYLVYLLQNCDYNLENLSRVDVTDDQLAGIDPHNENPIPVIYQSGYLTIKGYDKEFAMYELGFPNKEVEQGFMSFLLPFYINSGENARRSSFEIRSFVKDVREGNTEQFIKRLKTLFADTPYSIIKDYGHENETYREGNGCFGLLDVDL